MRSFLIILSVLLLFGLIPLRGQPLLQYWNTEKGLSNNWISGITEDQSGYIWVATQNGLNKFDGYSFEALNYFQQDNGLNSSWVNHLLTDKEGYVWMSTFLGGLARVNPKTNLSEVFIYEQDTTAFTTIADMVLSPDDALWVGNRRGLFVKKAGKAVFERVLQQGIQKIRIAGDGSLLLLTKEGVHLYKDDTLSLILPNGEDEIISILSSSQNKIWAISKKRLYLLDEKAEDNVKKQWIMDINPGALGFRKIPVFEKQNGEIWVATAKGVLIIMPETGVFRQLNIKDFFPSNIEVSHILSFYEDSHQNFWIGTTNGLFLQSPFADRFKKRSEFDFLDQFLAARQVLYDAPYYWVATEEGLYRVDAQDERKKAESILKERILTLFKGKNGQIYAGGKAFHIIDPTTLAIRSYPSAKGSHNGFKGAEIWAMEEDQWGGVWIGAVNGLTYFEAETNSFYPVDIDAISDLNSIPSQALHIDKENRLWAGSLRDGVYIIGQPRCLVQPCGEIKIEHLNFEKNNAKSLSCKLVVNIAEDMDGNIWIGTDGGLNKVDPNTFEVKRYLKKDGLIDEKIMALAIDKDGFLWGSTIGHGLFRLNPATDELSFYGRGDGLVSNNFLLNSCEKTNNGLLFFGSDHRIQCVQPRQINAFVKPSIRFQLSAIAIDGDSQQVLSEENSIEGIKLPYDFKTLRVNFSTLNYFQAEKTAYYYQLHPIQQEWLSNNGQRFLQFTGLKRGAYVLKIKAVNPDFDFEEATLNVPIEVLPAWWQSITAIIIYALGFIGVVWLIYHYQLKRKLQKIEEDKQREIKTLKKQLFDQIADEFQKPLRSIMGNIKQLATTNKKETKEKITLVERSVGQLLKLSGHISDVAKLEAGKAALKAKLRKRFHDNGLERMHFFTEKNKDDPFLLKTISIVEVRMEENGFGITELCADLNISRGHLHRKLKALTGLSASHFIRQIRLQKAKYLLTTTDMNVSEVAYEVGFSDPSYFSKLYVGFFNESPGETRG